MGRPGVTLEDVESACKSLARQGRQVGPQNVRLEIESGSFTTIIRLLRLLGHSASKSKKKKPD